MQSTLDGRIPIIVIDTHEIQNKKHNTCTVLVGLLKKNNIDYVIKTLPVGDILLPFGIVIERKTFSDFVSSLKGTSSGVLRLETQIQNMIETYTHPILLIENGLSLIKSPIEKCIYVPIKKITKKSQTVFITRKINMSPIAYDNLLLRFKDMGITVVEAYDAVHAAYIVFSLLKSILKAKNENLSEVKIKDIIFPIRKDTGVPIIRGRPKLMEIKDLQEFFLAGLPLINKHRAKAILSKFNNPINAINNIDQWQEIHGIGKKIIKEIKKILFTEYTSSKNENKDNENKAAL